MSRAHIISCGPVIESLLCAMVDDPRAVQVDARPVPPKRVNWRLCVDVNDYGKMVGLNGVTIRAIKLLIEAMGSHAGEEWVTIAVDPTGEDRAKRRIADKPPSHDPGPDVRLLGDILRAADIGATTHVTGNVDSGFNVLLVPSSQQALAALEEQHEAIYSRNQRERSPLTLVAALNAVFRAVGGRQGVNYRISVPQ